MAFIGDFSEFQPEKIDFNQLKSQVDFVILRDQYGYTIKDPHYDNYVAGCKAAGIPFNTYAFFAAVDTNDAVAEEITDNERMDKSSVVAWLDVETMSIKSGKDSDLQAAVNAYYDALKANGWAKVGIYSGEYFYNSNGLANCKRDCLWIAKYNANDGTLDLSKRPAVDCDLWQFTSVGKLNGVSGNVDLSVLVGSKPLSYFTGVGPSGSKTLTLPAKNPDGTPDNKWTVYHWDKPPVKSNPANIAGELDPAKFNGLTYPIIQDFGGDVYGIHSSDFGQVKIYAGPGTGAVITTITPAPPVTPPAPPAPAPEPPKPAPVAPIETPAPKPVEAAPVETPKPVEPAPVTQAEVGPIPSQEPAPVAPPAPKQYNVVLPNLRGFSLGAVHEYIVDKGWGYKANENKDGTIELEIGIFAEGSHSLADFEAYLDTEKFIYSLKETTV